MTVEILNIGKGGSRSIILIKCFPLAKIVITDIIINKLFIIICTIVKTIMLMARQYNMYRCS